jgi:hypothetical protein
VNDCFDAFILTRCTLETQVRHSSWFSMSGMLFISVVHTGEDGVSLSKPLRKRLFICTEESEREYYFLKQQARLFRFRRSLLQFLRVSDVSRPAGFFFVAYECGLSNKGYSHPIQIARFARRPCFIEAQTGNGC